MLHTTTDLLLLGAGHAHLDVLRQFALKKLRGTRLTLVAREALSLHAPMLSDVLYGTRDFDAVHTDLVPLAEAAGARLILSEAHGIDLAARQLQVGDRPDIGFDVLSVDVGGVSRPSGHLQKAASESGVPLQPAGQFLARFGELEQRQPHGAHIAVVGNTPTAVELVLALAHRFAGRFSFTLVSRDLEPLIQSPPRIHRLIRTALVQAHVGIVNGVTVVKFDGKSLYLSDGTALDVSDAIWATDARAPEWLTRTAGFAVTDTGFVCVDAALRSVSHDFVFAAGSCASVVDDTQGTNSGTLLADNLRRAISGQALRMQPQQTRLGQMLTPPVIVRTSMTDAVSWHNNVPLSGGWLLRWKNNAGQTRLRNYAALRPTAAPPAARPQQAAPGIMQRVIASMPQPQSADILLGLDVQNDAALVMPPLGSATVQSVSLLRAPVSDPFITGEISAAHAMGPIFAMGAHPWAARALAQLPPLSARSLENDLEQMLHGATRILSDAHCLLTGGHDVQSSSDETLFGFSMTGLVRPEQAISMHTLRAGDALILTKPIGSSTIVENNARGLVPARWLLAAIASMRRTDAPAMEILRAHDIHACANLADAGLAGTILNMLRTTAQTVTLDQAAIPVLPGAQTLCDALPNHDAAHPLLFAPQISGGLLAAVPQGRAESCVMALQQAGMEAAVIGAVGVHSDTANPLQILGTLRN